MGKISFYQITDDIYFDDQSIFLIKVIEHDTTSDPEFCYAESRDVANGIIEKLADRLVDELTHDPQVASGKVKISVERIDRSIVIRKQVLGRWINGTPAPVYTLSYNEVNHGLIKSDPEPEPEPGTIDPPPTIIESEVPTTSEEEDPLDKLIAELKVILENVGTDSNDD
jgi:hypothetical protein